jgi:hypothetical protein
MEQTGKAKEQNSPAIKGLVQAHSTGQEHEPVLNMDYQ